MKRKHIPDKYFSCLQLRRAYKAHYGKPLPDDMPYQEGANQLMRELGIEKAQELVCAQSNNPNTKE